MNVSLRDNVKRQIDALELDRDRPLVICDVDEVVVHFIRSLEAHLDENGYWLDTSSFALNGNIRYKSDDRPVTTTMVGELLYGCFDVWTHRMEMIDGAAESLESLSGSAEIVMLTNLPERYLGPRTENLRGHGIHFPVVANTGHKGPAVRELIADLAHDAFFIDDSPNNIESVSEWMPDTHLIHFIPDQRFARHVSSIAEVALRTDNWPETHTFITETIGSG